MATIYLGLGTNLGDKLGNLTRAIGMLSPDITVNAVSPIYETEPMLVRDQPVFYNLALEGETVFSPHEVLAHLKRIESEMGRVESVRYGPRLIDLDLLFYDDAVVESPGLTVPHAHIAERAFVLAPLADIAPELEHPILRKKVRDILAELPAGDAVAVRTAFTP